jgi:hypothetical protein
VTAKRICQGGGTVSESAPLQEAIIHWLKNRLQQTKKKPVFYCISLLLFVKIIIIGDLKSIWGKIMKRAIYYCAAFVLFSVAGFLVGNMERTLEVPRFVKGFGVTQEKFTHAPSVKLPDGSFIKAIASFNSFFYHHLILVKIKPDGFTDFEFGIGGGILILLNEERLKGPWNVLSIVVRDDNKILVTLQSAKEPSHQLEVQYTMDGTVDKTFGIDGKRVILNEHSTGV